MGLNNIKQLAYPLEFLFDEKGVRIGICVKEKTADGKKDRFHRFDPDTYDYLGYRERELDPGTGVMLSSSGVTYEYKRTVQNGERKFYRRQLGPIYQIGKKRAVSEKAIPRVEVIDGVARIDRPDLLPVLNREKSKKEILEDQARQEGRTLAEIYSDRDNSLRDDPNPVSLPEAKFNESGKAELDFGDHDPETPGMGTY